MNFPNPSRKAKKWTEQRSYGSLSAKLHTEPCLQLLVSNFLIIITIFPHKFTFSIARRLLVSKIQVYTADSVIISKFWNFPGEASVRNLQRKLAIPRVGTAMKRLKRHLFYFASHVEVFSLLITLWITFKSLDCKSFYFRFSFSFYFKLFPVCFRRKLEKIKESKKKKKGRNLHFKTLSLEAWMSKVSF